MDNRKHMKKLTNMYTIHTDGIHDYLIIVYTSAVVTYVYAKISDDRLWNEKALADRKSENNKNKNKNNVGGHWGPRTVQCESKNPLRGLVAIFPKPLGIFQPNFTSLLCFPIYARLRIFIQLSSTLTKLCHIKRDHPVHIICSKCPPSAETHTGWSHLIMA